MGINLSVSCAFKPKRKLTDRQLRALDGIGCYQDSGVHDDGTFYINASDVSGHGSDALDEFIRKHATDYVIVSGDCDEGPFEELVCPPHVDEKDARVRWTLRKVAALLKDDAPDFLAALRKTAELADAFALDWVMHEGADDPDAEAAAQQVAVVQRFLKEMEQ